MADPKKPPSYGGGGGNSFDDVKATAANPPVSIQAITVRTGKYVDRLEPTYLLKDGSIVSIPHGGTGGSGAPETIPLASNERLVGIRGRSGKYVDQISFVIDTSQPGGPSTQRIVGPFGGTGGNSFEIWGEVVAFYGRSGSVLDAIGCYVDATTTALYGGLGGSSFCDPAPVPDVTHITKIVLWAGSYIDAIATTYHLPDGSEKTYSHGGKTGTQHVISFSPGERIVSASGSTGIYLYEISFRTEDAAGVQHTYGPYGTPGGGFPFTVNGNVGAFIGRSGDYIDAIGFYLT